MEPHLGLEKLYVLGTNCVDNGPREGLEAFLQAASNDPDTVLHYEFMQVLLHVLLVQIIMYLKFRTIRNG